MSEFGNASESFEERQSKWTNVGEDMFKSWCQNSGRGVFKIGFDEKNRRVPQHHYNALPELLRKLPDFIVTGNKCSIVEVKGTVNFKRLDYQNIDKRVALYSNEACKFWYVFCIPNRQVSKLEWAPIWKTPEEVKALYEEAEDKSWHDGVVYRTLNISHDENTIAYRAAQLIKQQ